MCACVSHLHCLYSQFYSSRVALSAARWRSSPRTAPLSLVAPRGAISWDFRSTRCLVGLASWPCLALWACSPPSASHSASLPPPPYLLRYFLTDPLLIRRSFCRVQSLSLSCVVGPTFLVGAWCGSASLQCRFAAQFFQKVFVLFMLHSYSC